MLTTIEGVADGGESPCGQLKGTRVELHSTLHFHRSTGAGLSSERSRKRDRGRRAEKKKKEKRKKIRVEG